MSKESSVVGIVRQNKWDEKTRDYTRVDVEVAPIRRKVDVISTSGKNWFGKKDWRKPSKTLSKTETIQYFWNGEWIDIPSEYNHTEV